MKKEREEMLEFFVVIGRKRYGKRVRVNIRDVKELKSALSFLIGGLGILLEKKGLLEKATDIL